MYSQKPPLSRYIVAYALYVVVLLLCVGAFDAGRLAIPEVLAVWATDNPGLSVIYGAFILLYGMALFGLAVATEPYFRTGVVKNTLLPRFARISLPLLGCIIVFVGALTLVPYL